MRYDKLLIVATRAARPARKASARNARFETRFVVRNARASPLGLERCLHVFIEKFSKNLSATNTSLVLIRSFKWKVLFGAINVTNQSRRNRNEVYS